MHMHVKCTLSNVPTGTERNESLKLFLKMINYRKIVSKITWIEEAKDIRLLHPEEYPLQDNLETKIDENASHKEHLRNEHSVDVNERLEKSVKVVF